MAKDESSKKQTLTPKDDFAKRLARLNSYNYVVAYLDVLGATKYMEDDSEQFLNNLNAIYEKALDDVMFTNVVSRKKIDIKIFSDNILIAVKTSQHDTGRAEKIKKIFELAGNIYCNALDYGYLMRGGITEGKFYKNNTFVFGKALVEAVKLEEKIAIYPRIVVQEELIHLIPQYIMRDNDGEWYLNSFFINGFGSYEKYKTNILELLQINSNNRKAKQKLNWLVNYFNHFYCSQTCNDEPEHEPISLLDINKTPEEESNLCNEVSND